MVRRAGVLGVEIGAGAGWSGGNLLSAISGLDGICPVQREAVFFLKVCFWIEESAERNSSLSKSEHPVRVAASIDPAWKCLYGWKQETSSGCKRWIVCGGRQNRMMS